MTSLRIALFLGLLLSAVPAMPTAAQQSDRGELATGGWTMAAPEEHGIDPAALAAVDARVPFETPDLSALLVVRHGELVFERYYNGHEPDDPINTRSVTKSVTGTLVGIALAEGYLESLDQTVGELIPDRIPSGADPRIADVTVRQLLTMTSGLAWDAGSDWPTLTASGHWVNLTLGLPVVGIPDETYVYNTGGSHLLGIIVADLTGRDLADYAQEKLFDPLDITPGDWMRSPQGDPSAGSGLELTPRDMAKLGQLYLDDGRWNGRQILPADYVRAATTWQSAGDATGGWAGYGYQWWITATDAGYRAYFALGYGGQHIFVVPDLDLVVVAAIARRVPREELRTPRYLIESIAAAALPDASSRAPRPGSSARQTGVHVTSPVRYAPFVHAWLDRDGDSRPVCRPPDSGSILISSGSGPRPRSRRSARSSPGRRSPSPPSSSSMRARSISASSGSPSCCPDF